MIHFDFIVDNDEAETIFECLQDQIYICNDKISEYKYLLIIDKTNNQTLNKEGIDRIESEIEGYKSRITYLKDIKSKMTNVLVKK